MTTLIWRSDAHMSDVQPHARIDDWRETILRKIQEIGEIAVAEKADAVIDGGDFFHVKEPGRTKHATIQAIANAHKDYPCKIYSNVGNHDLKHGKLEYLNESPLGVLFATSVFQPLYDNYEAVIGDVRIVGVPYHGTTYNRERFRIKKGSERYLVVIAHILASDSGTSMYDKEDVLTYKELAEICPDASVFCFGHWHEDQGIKKIGEQYFVNIGSISRPAFSDMNRKPSIAVLRFGDTVECEQRFLKVEEPAVVFNLEVKERKEARKDSIESFVENLPKNLSMRKGESIVDSVKELLNNMELSLEEREEIFSEIESKLEKAGVA